MTQRQLEKTNLNEKLKKKNHKHIRISNM